MSAARVSGGSGSAARTARRHARPASATAAARWEFWLLAAEGHFLRSRGSNESEPYFAGMEALKCAAMFRDLIHILRESVN